MVVNVPDRDELGRFVSWAKKKGGEALDNIKKGTAKPFRDVAKGATFVADVIEPVEDPDEQEDVQDPSIRRAELLSGMGKKMDSMSMTVERKVAPLPKKEYTPPTGPAQKRKQGPWSMERKAGW